MIIEKKTSHNKKECDILCISSEVSLAMQSYTQKYGRAHFSL